MKTKIAHIQGALGGWFEPEGVQGWMVVPSAITFSLIKDQWMRKQQQMSVMVQLILDPTGHAGGTPIFV